MLSSCSLQSTGQQGADTLNSPTAAHGTKRADHLLPHGVIVGAQQLQKRLFCSLILEQTESTDRVESDTASLRINRCGIQCFKSSEQKRDGIRVLAAHLPEPPGGVVLRRRVLRLTEVFDHLRFTQRFHYTQADAIPLLLRALEALDATPIDPEQRGVALNAIRALGLLRDMRAEQPLLALLHSNDYTVREEVVRTLGAMGSCGAVEGIRALLASGLEGAGAEQPSSPLLNEPCEALLEALGDIGDGSSSNLAVIHPFTEHPRPLIRSAACRALLQLTGLNQWGMELKKLLNHPEPLVRRGALLDLGATGWIAAVPSIRTAAVEPSLKLVALREVAERNDDPDDVLDAMDRLL